MLPEITVGRDGRSLLVVWRVGRERAGKLVVLRPGTKVVVDISGVQRRLRDLIRAVAQGQT